jgi:hypothetical protein
MNGNNKKTKGGDSCPSPPLAGSSTFACRSAPDLAPLSGLSARAGHARLLHARDLFVPDRLLPAGCAVRAAATAVKVLQGGSLLQLRPRRLRRSAAKPDGSVVGC